MPDLNELAADDPCLAIAARILYEADLLDRPDGDAVTYSPMIFLVGAHALTVAAHCITERDAEDSADEVEVLGRVAEILIRLHYEAHP